MALGAAVLVLVSGVGVVGYLIAGWSLVDALYMVIITVFSVGYGEVHEQGPTLRWFTMALIVGGCSSLIYILGAVFQMITEGQLDRALGTKRMERNLKKWTEHIIVCGYGRMGRILCQQVAADGFKVVVIDENAERRDEALAAGHFALCADATRDAVLQSAGVSSARALATVLSSDALNVFITLTARALNPKLTIVARGELPSTKSKLEQAGANHTVLPAAIGAQRVADVLTRPSVLSFFENADLGALEQELLEIGIEIEQFEVTASSTHDPQDRRPAGKQRRGRLRRRRRTPRRWQPRTQPQTQLRVRRRGPGPRHGPRRGPPRPHAPLLPPAHPAHPTHAPCVSHGRGPRVGACHSSG